MKCTRQRACHHCSVMRWLRGDTQKTGFPGWVHLCDNLSAVRATMPLLPMRREVEGQGYAKTTVPRNSIPLAAVGSARSARVARSRPALLHEKQDLRAHYGR